MARETLKEKERLYSSLLQQEGRLTLPLLEQKAGEFLSNGGSWYRNLQGRYGGVQSMGVSAHWVTPKSVIRPSGFAKRLPSMLGSYPHPWKLRDKGAVFPDEDPLKGWLPDPWERHPFVGKLARGWRGCIQFPKVRERILIGMFSKVDSLSKGRSGA